LISKFYENKNLKKLLKIFAVVAVEILVGVTQAGGEGVGTGS
jgi:hypothetical protein